MLILLASKQRLFTQIKVFPQSASFSQLQPSSGAEQSAQVCAPESSSLQRWPFSQFPLPKQGQLALPTHPVQRSFSQVRPLLQLLSVLHAQPAVPSGQVRQVPSSQRKPPSHAPVGVQRQAALPGVQLFFSGMDSPASAVCSVALFWQVPWRHESPDAQPSLAVQAHPLCEQSLWSGFPPSGELGGVQAEKQRAKENQAPSNKKARGCDEAFMQKNLSSGSVESEQRRLRAFYLDRCVVDLGAFAVVAGGLGDLQRGQIAVDLYENARCF